MLLALIHTHKTAGTTMRYILRSSFSTHHCDIEPCVKRKSLWEVTIQDLERARQVYPHLKSVAGHEVTGYVDLGTKAINYFTFLRDPVIRLASHYQFIVEKRKEKNLNLEDWVQRDWVRNRHTKMIAGKDEAAQAIHIIHKKDIFIGLTESFDESLILFRGLRAPLLDISYKSINVDRRNQLRDNLLSSPRTRQILIEANRADIELYNYVKRELYPKNRKEYGGSLAADLAKFREERGSFNRINITAARLKRYLIYRPWLYTCRFGLIP